MPDPVRPLTEDALGRVEQLLPALARLAGARVRLWRIEGQTVRAIPAPDDPPEWTPELDGEGKGHGVQTPEGPAWCEPVRGVDGVWLEVGG